MSGVHPDAEGLSVNEESLRQSYPPDAAIARSIIYHYLFAEAKAGRRLVDVNEPLPCDVKLEQGTTFRAGVRTGTLLLGISRRRPANPPPEAPKP